MNENARHVPDEIAAEFRERVKATGGNHTQDALIEAVWPVVERLKSSGKPPDEVRAALRQLSRDLGLSTSQYTFGIHQGNSYRMIDGVISTCIEKSYFFAGRATGDGAVASSPDRRRC